MRNRQITIAAMFLVAVAVTAFGQTNGALIESVDGTVEVQLPGEEWQTVEAGEIVPVAARISTGFGATAEVAVTESTTVTVDPLTRIAIEELAVEEGLDSSAVGLEVGRIEGSVERGDDRTTEFDVRSPVATASVRGTTFLFDGEELAVDEGVVGFISAIGRVHSVGAGEQNFTYDVAEQPRAPAAARVDRRSVSHRTAVR